MQIKISLLTITTLLTLPKLLKATLTTLKVHANGKDVQDAGYKSGQDLFLMCQNTPEAIYQYDETGTSQGLFNSNLGSTEVMIDVKGTNYYLAGTSGSKTLLLDVTNNSFSQVFTRGPSDKDHKAVAMWQGTIFLCGGEPGTVYKIDYTNDGNLGSLDATKTGNTAGDDPVKILEVVNKGNFIFVSHGWSSSHSKVIDATDMSMVNENIGEGTFSLLSPSFSTVYLYTMGYTASRDRAIQRYKTADFTLGNEVGSNGATCIILNEIKGMKQIIGSFSDRSSIHEIRVYDENLVLVHQIPHPDQQGRVTYLRIHDTKPIIAIGDYDSATHPHVIYKLTELCNSACQETCVYRETLTEQNCGPCLSGFEQVSNGDCKALCQATEYRDPTSFECRTCPTCCEGGCSLNSLNVLQCTTTSSGFYLKEGGCINCPDCCQGTCSYDGTALTCSNLKDGWTLEGETCEENSVTGTTSDTPAATGTTTGTPVGTGTTTNTPAATGATTGTSTGTGTTTGTPAATGGLSETKAENEPETEKTVPEIIIKKKNSLEYQIIFPEGIWNFDKKDQIEVKIKDMIEETDFTWEIEQKESDPKVYNLKLIITRKSYQTDLTITLKNCQTASEKHYPEIKKNIKIFKILDELLGFSKPTQKKVKTLVTASSNNLDYLTLFAPVMLSFLTPINTLKIMALIPVKFPAVTLALLNMLVSFEEGDFTASFQDRYFYTREDRDARLFCPENHVFCFVSIYTRTHLFKIFLRILINLIFFLLSKKNT